MKNNRFTHIIDNLYFEKMTGVFSKIPSGLKIAFGFWWQLFLLFVLSDFFMPVEPNIQYSTIITAKDETVVHAFLSNDEKWRMRPEEGEISERLKKAILYKEDRFFYFHPGVNPFAIARALFVNTISGKRTSGASTITMQLARLLTPKERTYVNKVFEIFTALQLEFNFSKDEILEMYLTLAPYGGNIEGIKAASVLYFDKSPANMSFAEIAVLAVIPNRPNSLKFGKDNGELIKMRNKWLKKFKESGKFDTTEINDALFEPLNAFRRSAPQFAPQFSYRMKQENPGVDIIKTSLDIKKQVKIQDIAKKYINSIYSQGVHNCAVLVVDNDSRKVVSYIGSADFYNTEDAGQVDGITAIRSPGSTLKPLLYGLAFDLGQLTPKTIIADVPVNYSGYEPENYDEQFRGEVTAEHALANSLNIPAVKAMDKLGLRTMLKAFENLNFVQITKDKKKLGHSVILGGCGAELEELTAMYVAFANKGKYAKLNYLKTDTSSFLSQIISEESNFMLSEILTQVTRPDMPNDWQNSAHLPKAAWKTGTSYGRKDAWSIGYTQKYTVGVWVGNFSGEGVPGMSGSQTAAPLLFKIFNTIDYNSAIPWSKLPENIDFREVCSHSGLLPSLLCENTTSSSFIPGVSSMVKCNCTQEVEISPDSTKVYCTDCLPENGYKKALYRNYSAEMTTFNDANSIVYSKIPAHNSECVRVFAGDAPKITSPISRIEYLIDQQDSTKIMLTSHVRSDVKMTHWYINDKFIESVPAGEKLFTSPPEGKVKISCSDDRGRNTNIYINVKYIAY